MATRSGGFRAKDDEEKNRLVRKCGNKHEIPNFGRAQSELSENRTPETVRRARLVEQSDDSRPTAVVAARDRSRHRSIRDISFPTATANFIRRTRQYYNVVIIILICTSAGANPCGIVRATGGPRRVAVRFTNINRNVITRYGLAESAALVYRTK